MKLWTETRGSRRPRRWTDTERKILGLGPQPSRWNWRRLLLRLWVDSIAVGGIYAALFLVGHGSVAGRVFAAFVIVLVLRFDRDVDAVDGERR
jgi:hypothetical protein